MITYKKKYNLIDVLTLIFSHITKDNIDNFA